MVGAELDLGQVAVITVAHGRHRHLWEQQRRLQHDAPETPRWVVAIEDPQIPAVIEQAGGGAQVLPLAGHSHGLPLAAARNRGAQAALAAGAEVLIFLDVDCLAEAALVPRYAEVAASAEPMLWCGPVTYLPAEVELPAPGAELLHLSRPHPARPAPAPGQIERGGAAELFWSLSFAVHRRTWERIGGFCEEYVGYGGEDTDVGFTARAAGAGLAWVGGAQAFHQHHPVSTPPVEHAAAIVRNANLFRARWGVWIMQGWLRELHEMGVVVWTAQELREGPNLR